WSRQHVGQLSIDLEIMIDRGLVLSGLAIGIRHSRDQFSRLLALEIRIARIEKDNYFSFRSEEVNALKDLEGGNFFRSTETGEFLVEFHGHAERGLTADVIYRDKEQPAIEQKLNNHIRPVRIMLRRLVAIFAADSLSLSLGHTFNIPGLDDNLPCLAFTSAQRSGWLAVMTAAETKFVESDQEPL